jgi:hypothetical protein
LESAVAVEPPTRPVPPRTNTLELRIFSGISGRLVAVAVAVTLKLKLRGNEVGAIDFYEIGSLHFISLFFFFSVLHFVLSQKILILFLLSLLLPRSLMRKRNV